MAAIAAPSSSRSPRGSAARDALAALRGPLDRLIAAHSLVPDDAVLDMRGFAWTGGLRDTWQTIRDEALSVPGGALWRDGAPVAAMVAQCPATAAALATIPGLERAGFARLDPGAELPVRRGATKALLTCHLGLAVPHDGDARMRVGDRVLRWAEGETLVFDDSRPHWLTNDGSAARMVLSLRFRRPLRQPGGWIAERLIGYLRRGA